jgi:hypothetical protein
VCARSRTRRDRGRCRRVPRRARSCRDLGIERDRDETAVALRAERDALDRAGPIARVALLGVAVVHAAHGAAGGAGKQCGDERVRARAGLRAEAAAHVLEQHAHVRVRQVERARQIVPRVEDALRGFPHREPAAHPFGDGGVGLERRVERRGRAVLARDHDVGALERGGGVAALGDLRIAQEIVAGERVLSGHRVGGALVLGDDRRERALGVARGVGAHGGQRLSGVVDVGREESPAR